MIGKEGNENQRKSVRAARPFADHDEGVPAENAGIPAFTLKPGFFNRYEKNCAPRRWPATREELRQYAEWMREHPTKAEAALSRELKRLAKKNKALRFKQQVPKCHYILDFFFPAARVAVEVDGNHHYNARQRAYDQRRDHILSAVDIPVLRFSNDEVLEDVRKVGEAIAKEVVPRFHQRWKERIRHANRHARRRARRRRKKRR